MSDGSSEFPSARILADSVSDSGFRVTSMEVCLHRFVLAEFNTHCVLSRNSASSRALPVRKQLARVKEELAYPVSWPAEQPGMSGGSELVGEDLVEARAIWEDAADDAVILAERLVALGVHKSVTNRLLEPFLRQTVVVTATAWQNFFRLRTAPDAQPEIRAVAVAMEAAYRDSEPTEVLADGWHLPFIDRDDRDRIADEDLPKVSAARVARVSYLTHDGHRDPAEDLKLYDRLVASGHSSPLEHVCTPYGMNLHRVETMEQEIWPGLKLDFRMTLPKYGKFLGWHQLRYTEEALRRYQAFS